MHKFKVIKKLTKNWSSGLTTFAILSDSEHKDRNYVVMKRILLGKSANKQQFFNLHFKDWTDLKSVVEVESVKEHEWPIQKTELVKDEVLIKIEQVLKEDPDFIEKVLANKNIAKLSAASLEALDRLGLRIYEIKAENIDIMLKKLSEAEEKDITGFASLLNDLRIGQISSIAELVKKKISIIKLLQILLKDKKTKEQEIHKLLENNLWLLDNNYDLVKSNKPLSEFLAQKLGIDSELGKRPDLILKIFLQDERHIVLVELKRPNIRLNTKHVGQVLGYKGIIQNHNPNLKVVDTFLIGFDLDPNMPKDLQDIKIELLENIINRKRSEFNEFLSILEDAKEEEFSIL